MTDRQHRFQIGQLVDLKPSYARAAAKGTQNLLYPMRDALAAKATLGEVSDAMRDVFGLYQPSR